MLGQKNTTDLDITFDEPLVFPIVDHDHAFEDVPAFSLPPYSIEEIFVEKLRSLYQRARARDSYETYRLLEQESFDDEVIVTALRGESTCSRRGDGLGAGSTRRRCGGDPGVLGTGVGPTCYGAAIVRHGG